MEELKKEILKKSESSNKSLKTYDQPVEKITENNDMKNQNSMKNLSNVMLANIFLKRTKQIPKQALEKRQKERDLYRKNEEEIARRREEEIARQIEEEKLLIKQNLKHKNIHYGDRGKTERRKFASKHHEVEAEEEYEEEEIEYEEEEEEEVEVIDDIRSKSSGVFSGYD